MLSFFLSFDANDVFVCGTDLEGKNDAEMLY